MRISDWSSDVCSSDLLEELYFRTRGKAILGKIKKSRDDFMSAVQKTGQLAGEGRSDDAIALMKRETAPANKRLLNGIGELIASQRAEVDRTSRGLGKKGSGRVGLGGGGNIKKK